MNAVRRDEELDNLHSIYVDQWDWERVITADQRTLEFLQETVRDIVDAVCATSDELRWKFPELKNNIHLGREVAFITTQELEDRYPDFTPKQRENAFAKEHGTVCIMQIGGRLKSGQPHDGRAPDYDDWTLNCDILFWHKPLDCALELSSMGIRVDADALRRQLDAVVSDVSDTLSGVRTLSADARALQAALSDTTAALNTTVDLLRPAAERMVSALSDTIDKLEGLSADEYMDMLLEILGGDPIAYSQYFPQMVQTTVHKVYPIENYGSAMAPFYTTLAIWVGCVILSTLIKVHARTDGLIDPTPAELYFGRYLFFFLLSQIQAAVIVTGDLYLLGIQCEHPGLLYLTASLTAFTFSLLIYSLALSFGDVGKALVVVVMVMQIAGSSGTFPIELLPEIYQKIYRFFPFPYAIDAMRECICGLYGDYYIRQLAFLLLFVAAALLIGLLVRRPFMGLNRFMEEKLEETELL